jgi:hypothetical protein
MKNHIVKIIIIGACWAQMSCSYFNPTVSPQLLDKMRIAYAAGNFFELDTYLSDSISRRFASPEVLVFRAANSNFFNDLAESERVIAQYYADFDKIKGSDTLRFDLLRLRLDNALKLQRYGDAVSLCDTLTMNYTKFWTKDALQSLVRLRPIVAAVGKVVPMTCEKIADTQLAIGYDKQQHPKIPVQVGKFADDLSLDLSTQFCMIAESAAQHLGLRRIEGSFEAQSTLGHVMQASVAVADRLQIGQAVLKNVPFLVLPDAAMVTRGDSTPVHGTLGYGVLAALQEVVFTADRQLLIPRKAAKTPTHPNFGLVWYTPMLHTFADGKLLPMKLDLAQRTSSMYQNKIADTASFHKINFKLSDQLLTMDSLVVMRKQGTTLNSGTFGRDVLLKVKALRINFAAMQVRFE